VCWSFDVHTPITEIEDVIPDCEVADSSGLRRFVIELNRCAVMPAASSGNPRGK